MKQEQIKGNNKIRKCSGFGKKQPLEVFYKKGVFKNLAEFTRKQLRSSLFSNKVTGLRAANLLKRLRRRWFFF